MLRISLFMFSMIFLSGCMTMNLSEKYFLNPTNFKEAIPADYDFSEFYVERSDKTKAYGVAITKSSNSVTVMYFGGNQFTIHSSGSRIVKALTKIGLNVVIFDHRGYGNSTGVPTVELLIQDALYNYDYIRKNTKGIIVVHGQSLGSFEAGAVADDRNIDALVLESSATDVDEWSSIIVPWYAKPFVTINISPELKLLNNKTVVSHSKAPLLIIVGENDTQTPPYLSKMLYSASISKQKKIHVFPGSGHNTVPSNAEFGNVYSQFINEVKGL